MRVKKPNWPAIGVLKVTLAGCHGPRLPGLLLPFSDLCAFKPMPNLFTAPERPLPFVRPRVSSNGNFGKSDIEISFPIRDLAYSNFLCLSGAEIANSIISGVFLIEVCFGIEYAKTLTSSYSFGAFCSGERCFGTLNLRFNSLSFETMISLKGMLSL